MTRYLGRRQAVVEQESTGDRRRDEDAGARSELASPCLAVCSGAAVAVVVLCALLFSWLPVLPAPAGEIAPGCINLVQNGDFEVVSPHWQIQPGPRPPMYTNEVTFSDSTQALRIGNGVELPNIASVSEVRYNPVPFPRDATSIILRFRYQPRSDADSSNDLQQADLYYYNSDQLAFSLLNVQENDFAWKLVERDLTAFRGQVMSLRFRVHNDGLRGRTWMYIDDVEIEYCSLTPIAPTDTQTPPPPLAATSTVAPTASSTPSPTGSPTVAPTASSTPSPTGSPTVALIVSPTLVPSDTPELASPAALPWVESPTAFPAGAAPAEPWPALAPSPPGCVNFIANSSFESFSDWDIGDSPVPPRYTTDVARSGARSILLGNPPGVGENVVSYSSIRQLVSVPWSANRIELRWWQAAYSQEPTLPSAERDDDRQEVILLAPNSAVMGVLTRFRSTDGVWQQRALDLTPYRGRSFFVYFNVFNNADPARTWMYVDDVELLVCGAAPIPFERPDSAGEPPVEQDVYLPPPSPTSMPTDTPISSPTPPPPTDTPFLPTATPLPPTDTPPPPTVAIQEEVPPPATPTPTATEPGAAVAILTTPTATVGAGTPQVRAPVGAPAVSQPTAEPWWRRMLGALAVLCSIPVLIAIIIVLVVQIGRLRRASARQYP